MKEIQLSKRSKKNRGMFVALVDDDLFEDLNKRGWNAHKRCGHYYAASGGWDSKAVQMHRYIMGVDEPLKVVDHIDGNTLNNLRSNLRVCTKGQNNFNKGSYPNSSSKYKGVSWNKKSRKFRVLIHKEKQSYHIGMFEDEQDAALAYNEKAIELFGQFAKLNVINYE